MRSRLVRVLLLLVLCMSSLFSGAQLGNLHTYFGGDGIVDYNGPDLQSLSASAMQKNGDLVAVGHHLGYNSQGIIVVRFKSNGELDPLFNGNGIVKTVLGEMSFASEVVIQEDGKIVVSGSFGPLYETVLKLFLVRYNSDGTLDV